MPRVYMRAGPRLLPLLAAAALPSACSVPAEPPATKPSPRAAMNGAVDDGTYLDQIDPLGGHWMVQRIGTQDYTRFDASIDFTGGGFLNHGAGCHGGHPAFYRLSGAQITLTRLEPVRVGKCSSVSGAAESERRFGIFLDSVSGWSRPDESHLILTAADGTRATLTRQVEPHPDLAGRWLIEQIGGDPFVTEYKPAILTIRNGNIGVSGDCNGAGGTFAIAAPGRFAVSGPVLSTLIGCRPEDAAEDALMIRAITSANGYRVSGDRLEFTGGLGMMLRRPPPPDRRLSGRYEACGNTLLGAFHDGPVTLAIDAQTLTDNAGCTADYLSDGARLEVRPRAGGACLGESRPFEPGKPVGIGGSASTLAIATPDGFGFDEEGRLNLRTPRGLLTMCRAVRTPAAGG